MRGGQFDFACAPAVTPAPRGLSVTVSELTKSRECDRRFILPLIPRAAWVDEIKKITHMAFYCTAVVRAA